MMQIHMDAIQKSMVAETQYVLRKSLDMACVSDKKELLKFLKDGWEIVGKYHNGVGDYDYKTASKMEIASIKSLIEKEFFGFEINPATTVTISFREYFSPITYESEELNVYITFYNEFDGKLEYEKFHFQTGKAERVRDLLFILNMKQDKATVIHLIEKKMARKD